MTIERLPAWERRPEASLPLSRAVDLFVANYRSLWRSEDTIHWYRQRLAQFINWYEKTLGGKPTLANFTPQTFQLFILEKQTKPRYEGHPIHPQLAEPISSSTIHGYYRAVRGFGAWLADPGIGRTTLVVSLVSSWR